MNDILLSLPAVVENIALTGTDAEDMDKFCKFTEHEVLLSEG